MAAIKEIYEAINRFAPFHIQLGFDNAGFLVGHADQAVDRILVALDITEEVVHEAAEYGAQLIVSHHPVIFHPAKSVTDCDPTGRVLLHLIEAGIGAICAHTNLDAAQGGVNDCLAQMLELSQLEQLHQDGILEDGTPYGIGRVGYAHVEGGSARDYAEYVKLKLNSASVRYVDAGKTVHKVAVGGGSCGSMLEDAFAAGCDTFVTADVKYDVFLAAKALGINLMDAGHYATEQVVCPALAGVLQEQFPQLDIAVSQSHKEVYSDV